MILVGTCSGIVLPGIKAKLVRIAVQLISVGQIHSVVSVFFIFDFKLTEEVEVWGWKPVLLICFDFWALIFQWSLYEMNAFHQENDNQV